MELTCTRTEEVEQAIGTIAGVSSIEMHGVVLNGRTMTEFTKRLEIIRGPLFDSMGFDLLIQRREMLDPRLHLQIDVLECLLEPFNARHEEFLRVDPCLIQRIQHLERDRIHHIDALDAIESESKTQWIITAWHPEVKDLATKTHRATLKVRARAGVLRPHEFLDDMLGFDLLTHMESEVMLEEGLRWVQAVDA